METQKIEETKELHDEIIYTSLEEAKEELRKRWNDKKLRNKVLAYLNGDIPKIFDKEPKAFLARHITTPNFEFFRFLNLANKIELNPAALEYADDILTAGNPGKYYLCKILFYNGKGKNGGRKLSCNKLVSIDEYQGAKLSIVKTRIGCDLKEFHHNLMKDLPMFSLNNVFDISDWYKRRGSIAKNYYKYFFAFFICHGVLFENYLHSGIEGAFTRSVVLPNYKKTIDFFGVKPLIVRLLPTSTETDDCWWYYPEFIKFKSKS